MGMKPLLHILNHIIEDTACTKGLMRVSMLGVSAANGIEYVGGLLMASLPPRCAQRKARQSGNVLPDHPSPANLCASNCAGWWI
jgi:hypothetical protein